MQLIASVIDKCFKIQERGIPMGAGNEALLANFVTKVENQIDRLTDTEVSQNTNLDMKKPLVISKKPSREEETKAQSSLEKRESSRQSVENRMKSWLMEKSGDLASILKRVSGNQVVE